MVMGPELVLVILILVSLAACEVDHHYTCYPGIERTDTDNKKRYNEECKWIPMAIRISLFPSNRYWELACVKNILIQEQRHLRHRRSNSRGLKVRVHTSGEWYSGTGARVYIKIYGKNYDTGDIQITGNFNRYKTAENTIHVSDIGIIQSLRVRHDNTGSNPGWKLDWITLEELSEPGMVYHFDCYCWLEDNHISKTLYTKANTPCPAIDNCDVQRCHTCVTCDTTYRSSGYFYELTGDHRRCRRCSYRTNCETQNCDKCTKCINPPHGASYIYRMKSDMSGCYRSCVGMGSSKEFSVLWLSSDNEHCDPTCSYESQRWCWPGNCSDRLTKTCTCVAGFKKIGTASCDLATRPQLHTCNIRMTDSNGSTRQSTHGTNTGCQYESDTYINRQPHNVTYYLFSSFTTPKLTDYPNYIKDQQLGLVEGHASIRKLTVSGQPTTTQTDVLRGGSSCSKILSNTSPSPSLTCSKGGILGADLHDGERLCVMFSVSAGGYFTYKDFQGHTRGTKIFSRQMSDKQLCFRYDNSKPAHCSTLSGEQRCKNTSPLRLSSRITRKNVIRIQTSGWIDLVPSGGQADTASGLASTKIQILKMIRKGNMLDFNNPQDVPYNGSSNLDTQVLLPHESGLYAVQLEVVDKAGNTQTVRRIVLYDNKSTIRSDPHHPLRITTARKSTTYFWQTNHGPMCVDWKDRYYNDVFRDNDPLLPVISNPGVASQYDQTTGELPVSGTVNVYGITEVLYAISADEKRHTFNGWKTVPNFTNQSICLTLKLRDGQTYTVAVKMTDIIQNTLNESVTVHIDSTVPDISHMWLVKENRKQVYVHNSSDLSSMVLQFDVTDPHSGVKFVEWYLGTKDHSSDLGHGVLPVQKISGKTCSSATSCYCPAVGDCQYANYTVRLNNLVANGTNTGQHNQAFYFTVVATNGADLKNIDHLDILVDTSPPEPGSVKEGSADGHDIDYTSEDFVLINWAGFIDHESGIHHYLVAVAPTCLTLAEMNNSTQIKTIVVSPSQNEARFSTLSEGKFFASVVAYNEALSPSKAVCSDGITKDVTAPQIFNVTLANAKITDHIVCQNGSAWLVSRNLTLVRLETSPNCNKRCNHGSWSAVARVLPQYSWIVHDTNLTDSLCRDLPYLDLSSIIYLPSDNIYLSWNVSEPESQIQDVLVGFGTDISSRLDPDLLDYKSTKGLQFFKLNHAGFTGKTIFFVLIKAVNKAGLITYASIGPIMIDYTPPVVKGTLKPAIDGGYVYLRWYNYTFKDDEQQDNSYTLLYRIVHQDKHVTPILQTPEMVSSFCQGQGFAGCLRYPLKRLQEMDSELNEPFTFELYVYNSAGHYTLAKAEDIKIPSASPPGHGIVQDIDPKFPFGQDDVDYHASRNMTCIQWSGFYHHTGVEIEIAIGTTPNTTDVVPYEKVSSGNHSCLTSSSLQPWIKYYAIIRASCSGGYTVASSDGFVIVSQTSGGQYILQMFDGLGCSDIKHSDIKLRSVTSTKSPHTTYTTTERLHIGQTYTLMCPVSEHITNLDDVIVINGKGIGKSITFIPLVSFPAFSINTSDASSQVAQTIITMCSEDDQYKVSRSVISFHWKYLGPWESFTTHFEVQLQEEAKSSNGNTLFMTLGTKQVKSFSHYADFTNVVLHQSRMYRGRIRPCFETVCLNWTSTNGVKVITDKVSLQVSSKWDSLPSSVCDAIALKVDVVDCKENPVDSNNIVYQWSVADTCGQLLQPWKTEQRLQNGQVSVCLNSTYSSNEKLQVCLRTSCPSGLTRTVCDVVYQREALMTGDNLIEMSRKDIGDIKDDMTEDHQSMIQFDIDYVESHTEVAGVLETLEGRNSIWYIMSKRRTPPLDCDSDDKCIAKTESSGKFGTFPEAKLDNNGHYFICVDSPAQHSAQGSLLPRITECGDGFIVDDDPPTKGKVNILNQKDGFLTQQELLVVTWDGFTDHEIRTDGAIVSGIKQFSYSVGTSPGGQDLLRFTDAGFVHSVHITGIELRGGETYFITIKATDYLGHVTTGVSDPLTVDITPPVQGQIYIGSAIESHMVVSSDSLLIYWDGFHDRESGISSYYVSILSAEMPEVILETDYSGSFARMTTKGRLVDGHRYNINLQVTNRAGLVSLATSPPFIFDSSPPVPGVVRDGGQKIEHDYQTSADRVSCHWSNFHDPHSSLVYFRVGLGTHPETDDVETMTHVGLRSELTWTGNLPLGTKLYCTVVACNQAGLCCQSVSDGIILDNSPPVPGVVYVGGDGRHHKYHGHASSLTARWFGFEDPQTGISHFDWCVGSAAGSCNILMSMNNLLSDSVIKTRLILPLGTQLFVTVNATNSAGLIATSVSDSFVVDSSPPTLVVKPVFLSPYTSKSEAITSQWDSSVLHLSWRFTDPQSPIERHMISLSNHHDSTVAMENIHLGAQDTAVILFDENNLMRSGDTYSAVVTACNTAGLCSSASSANILIDSTPPDIGGVKYPLSWETVFKAGKNISRLHLRWYGFSDTESGIVAYKLAVTQDFDDSELSGGILTIPHNATTEDQSATVDLTGHVHTGDNVVISLIAENHVGLFSKAGKVTLTILASDSAQSHGTLDIQRHSCSIQYCTGECTCAVVGKTCIVNSNQNACNNITAFRNTHLLTPINVFPGISSEETVTRSVSCLSGHWNVGDQVILNQIKRFEWSMGQKGKKTGYPLFDSRIMSVWHNLGKETQVTYCLPNGTSLQHGTEYVVYLRVWFSYSQYAIFHSNPIMVDNTPPSIGRAKSPLDSDHHCTYDREFFKAGDDVTVCWSNVFQETNGSIAKYEFWLGTSPEGNDALDTFILGNQTSFTIPQSLLTPGTHYYASVRATNKAGLQTVSVSDGFVVDDIPPVAGVVFNTDRHRNIQVQNSNNEIRSSWHGFEDYHSYVARYEVAIIRADETLLDSMFKYHGLGNNLVVQNADLTSGQSYKIGVRAVDAAGLKSDVVFSPTLKIDTTPPHAFECASYHEKRELKAVTNVVNRPGLHKAEFKASHTMKKGNLYELSVVGQMRMYETRIIFEIDNISVVGRFEKKRSVAEASHNFVSDKDGQSDITITFTGPVVTGVAKVYIRECQQISTASSNNAIIVRQIRPSVLAVCTRVTDPDSGIKRVWMGAGTSKGGYQIRALSPTTISNHEMILVQEPHGSPVYITVLAENEAGLRTVFTSSQTIIDHTPPEVAVSSTTVIYHPAGTDTVGLDVTWQVQEDESDLDVCFCSAGKHVHSLTDNAWIEAKEKDHCIIPNITAHHNSHIHASVRCVNSVSLEAMVSSDSVQVLMYPPQLPHNSLQSLVDNQISTSPHRYDVQAYTDHVTLFWQGVGTQVESYECRLLDGETPMTTWISTGNRTYATLDDLSLQDGRRYEAQVRAKNRRNQYSNTLNTPVAVESRSPVTTGKEPRVYQHSGHLTLDWNKVFDVRNMSVVYTVSVGTREGYVDVVNQEVTRDTIITAAVNEQSLSEVFVTIMAQIQTGRIGVYSSFMAI